MNRLTVVRGETVEFRFRARSPQGRVLRPGLDTVVRVLAWAPGAVPGSDQPAHEAECRWNVYQQRWLARLRTDDWENGTWTLRADVSADNTRGMDWTEIEVTDQAV